MIRRAGVSIRPVGKVDCSALARFFEENARPEVLRQFHPFPLNAETACRITCGEHADRYYLARRRGRVVGLVMLRGWDEGYAIPSFGVLVEHRARGTGLGRALTEFATAEARQLGCPGVRLSVYASNVRARHLYGSLGFRETSRQSVEVAGEADEKIVMVKELG